MALRKYCGELPKNMADLRVLPKEKITHLWGHYFTGGKPQMKPLWYKIQCEQMEYKIESRHLSRLFKYAKNPELYSGRSHKVKYHLKPGTELVKKFRGTEHVVRVLADDRFTYNGKPYSTLSAIATEICGHKMSGNHFFGFDNKRSTE